MLNTTVDNTNSVEFILSDRLHKGANALGEQLGFPSELRKPSLYPDLETYLKEVMAFIDVNFTDRYKSRIKYTLYGVPIKIEEVVLLLGISGKRFITRQKRFGVYTIETFLHTLLEAEQRKIYTRDGKQILLRELAEEYDVCTTTILSVFNRHNTTEYSDIPQEVWYELKDKMIRIKSRKTEEFTYAGKPTKLRPIAMRLGVSRGLLYTALKRCKTQEITDIPKSCIQVWWKEYDFTYKGKKIDMQKTAEKIGIPLCRLIECFESEDTFELTPRVMEKAKKRIKSTYYFNGKEVSLADIAKKLKTRASTLRLKCLEYNTTDITKLVRMRKLWTK